MEIFQTGVWSQCAVRVDNLSGTTSSQAGIAASETLVTLCKYKTPKLIPQSRAAAGAGRATTCKLAHLIAHCLTSRGRLQL